MKYWRALCVVISAAVCPVYGHADDEAEPRLSVHGSLYFGLSNLLGPARRNTDGVWAGIGFQEPSTVSLSWRPRKNNEALVSFGVGEMYTGAHTTTRQPVECYFRAGSGSASWTFGKHYTPFGLQEWEYETRWGVLHELERDNGSMAVSVTYNEDTRAGNAMGRAEIRLGSRTSIGLSASAGRGWSYSSSHAWGYGLDCSIECGSVTIEGELLEGRGRNGTFQFGFLRARTEVCRGVAPYVALYYCHDVADEMGELRSGVLGVGLQTGPNVVIEPGLGRANGRNVWWFQTHVTF